MKTIDDASKAETSSVPEGVISKVATNPTSKVIGEEQVALDVVETDMTSNNLNSIFEDCFYSSNLNHISPIPLPKPSLEHTLKNVMNLVYSEHPAGETTDDKKQLTYFSDSEQPLPLNTMLGPLYMFLEGTFYLVLGQTQVLTLLLVLVSNLFLSNLSKLSLLKSSHLKNQNDQTCLPETSYG